MLLALHEGCRASTGRHRFADAARRSSLVPDLRGEVPPERDETPGVATCLIDVGEADPIGSVPQPGPQQLDALPVHDHQDRLVAVDTVAQERDDRVGEPAEAPVADGGVAVARTRRTRAMFDSFQRCEPGRPACGVLRPHRWDTLGRQQGPC